MHNKNEFIHRALKQQEVQLSLEKGDRTAYIQSPASDFQ